MGLPALVDRLIPGPGGLLDRGSQAYQDVVAAGADTTLGRPAHTLLHGNEWLGHPAHPLVVTVPIGAWCVTVLYDARSLGTADESHERIADAALGVGIVGALGAAATGVAQYLDTDGGPRREAAVHAALNNAALGLFAASWVLRKRRNRPFARRLALAGLAIVGVSGYLGGDLAYRHGVGHT